MFISFYRPLLWQTGAVSAAAMVGGLWNGLDTSLALLYGGGVAVCSAALLVWRWRQGARAFHSDVGRHLRSFYRSALERFFIVSVLLATGLGVLRLNGLTLLAGLLVGQLVWMAASLTAQERT
jgi:hypothetical protein